MENAAFYENWMSCLRDDAKLKHIAIPGSHNAGTYQMIPFARCQGGSLYEQYRHGVRFFDTRFHIGLNGKVVFEHGIMGGTPLEEGLRDIRRMIENNDSEFFVFDLHFPKEEYLIGKLGRHYRRDFGVVNELLEKYIEPQQYALTDFRNIADVTMGYIRRSGKRVLLNWDDDGIIGAVNAPLFAPWRPDYYGLHIDGFFEKTLTFFDEVPENALFCYFTQRTPGIGTEEGLKNPITLEKAVRKNFHRLTDTIANDPVLLEKANIIAGDFMTDSHAKSNCILSLNLKKEIVKPECEDLFYKMVQV